MALATSGLKPITRAADGKVMVEMALLPADTKGKLINSLGFLLQTRSHVKCVLCKPVDKL